MPKSAVVIRQMPGARPVTTAVIHESTSRDIDNMDHYLTSEAEESIRRFKNDFPEFRMAMWYIDLMTTHSNTPYETFEVGPDVKT